MDKRPAANQARRVKTPKEDLDTVVACAVAKHGGEKDPAWRERLQKGELSPELSERSTARPSWLRRMPRAIARQIGSEPKVLWDWWHRPRFAKLNGKYTELDWSDVAAGDWFEIGDFTPGVYFAVLERSGWWTLTRGQYLPYVDCRSKKIISRLLIPGSWGPRFVRTIARNETGLQILASKRQPTGSRI